MVGSNVFRAKFFSLYLPIALYLLVLLFPFYWMLIVSFKPTNDLFEMKFNPFWIQQFTLENYLYLFQNTDFPSWLNNTYWALILTYPPQLIPFASWLLMGYFRTIPKEIEESAMADGCSRIQILVRIVLPLSVPGLLSAGIFCFTLCWHEFLYALIL